MGGSLALAAALWLLRLDVLAKLVELNESSDELRWTLAGALSLGSAAGIVASLVLHRGGGSLQKVAAYASPLLLSSLVPMLRPVEVWDRHPLRFLVVIAVAGLVLERLLRRAFAALGEDASLGHRIERLSPAIRERLATWTVIVAALGYASFAGIFSILRHWRFESTGFDLGIQDNLMWNAIHGEPFRSTVVLPDGTSFLSHHAEFASLLFAPIYALVPGAETLLVFQAVYFGCAALPLYGFASVFLPRWIAAAIALVYLLYAPMHGPNFYDFHWLPFSIPILFSLFWALAVGRMKLAFALVVFALLIREDVSLGICGLGVFLVTTGIRPAFGAAITALAAAWFVLLKFVVMPSAGPQPFVVFHRGLIPEGEDGYGQVLLTLLLNPSFAIASLLEEAKVVYALHLAAPLGLVPLRRPWVIPLLVPGFLVTLLTTGYGPTLSIAFQYTAHWIPYLFAALALYLHGIERVERRAAVVIAIAVATLAHSHQFGALLQRETFVGGFERVSFDFSEQASDRLDGFRSLTARIPADASVATTEHEVPHLSTRREIYTLAIGNPGAEYLLIAEDHLETGRSKAAFAAALTSGAYELLERRRPYLLFRRIPAS